jgi:D-hexose-6-phosphate mutarotase
MTNCAQELNERFALPGALAFNVGPGGLLFADVHGTLADATVCLQGAHLLHWRPRSQRTPVIWISGAAQYTAGKSIRGGMPICWPWFGPHVSDRTLPNHGFVRTTPWSVCASHPMEDGAIQLCLELSDSASTRAFWPHRFHLRLDLTIGEELSGVLTSTNCGTADFLLGEALHTYFELGDVATARVLGLEGCDFSDTADGATRKRQAGPIGFGAEVDRVYLATATDCTIVDPALQRRIHIAKSGSRSTVVWNPGPQKAAAIGDLGPRTPRADGRPGWREMLCVESANALTDTVLLAPGAAHCLEVHYRALPLQ